jgi:hypothetical protein
MKKIITLLLAFVLAFAIALPVWALEDEAPIEIIVHYQYENQTDDPDLDLGLFTVGATIVLKDLGGGLINVEYGWSQFDGPFPTDDFGYILSFTAGYKETDVSQFVIRSADWTELSVIEIPINSQVNSKIELWAVAQADTTDAIVTTSAPSAATAPEPVVGTPVAETPAPATPAAGIKVTIDGTAVVFDPAPLNVNGSVLLPMRGIFEALGATLSWDGDTQTVTAVKDAITITMQIGNNTLDKNGESITVNVPAQLIGNNTFVPARVVAESFGAAVIWEADTETVVITN